MMIGSFLIKIIWVMGAKGKEGFLFETNQPVCSPSSQNPTPKNEIKKPQSKTKELLWERKQSGLTSTQDWKLLEKGELVEDW